MAYFYSDGDGSVCLATTSYANPDASYTHSMAQTREALHAVGINTRYFLLEGNCHVDDARNTIVEKFLATDCTDLIFIDADVSWEPEHLIELMQHEVDIVGGVYPFRRADKQLDMPVRMMPHRTPENGLLEVEGLPTGFMRIQRRVLEEMAKDAPSYMHNGANVPIVFQRTLEEGTRWGGDLNFCNKWRERGGHVYCVYDMTLGHAAKVIFHGSMGEFLRKKSNTTLRHVCDKIRAGTETDEDIAEAMRYADNPWGAPPELLKTVILLAREAGGPIIEAGSGLTTVLMAAATEQTVFCLEHHTVYYAKLQQFAAEAGVGNIGVCAAPLAADGWYDLTDMELPERFALGVLDGPPRIYNTRNRFFDEFEVDTVIVDDMESFISPPDMEVTPLGPRVGIVRNTMSGAA